MKLFFRILFRFAASIGILVALLLAALAFLHHYRPALEPIAVPPSKPVSGAAVYYYQAFDAMPKLSLEEKKLLLIYQPMDEDALQELLKKWEVPLRFLEQGASQNECEWGRKLEVVDTKIDPNWIKAKTLAYVAGARFRLHLFRGENAQAVDDILMLFRFSRHIGAPETGINAAVGRKCNMVAMREVAYHLRELDRDSLRKLIDCLSAMPGPPSIWKGIDWDFGRLQALLHNTYNEEIRSPSPEPPRSKDLTSSWKRSVCMTVAVFPFACRYNIKEFDQCKAELEQLMALPLSERQPKLEAFYEGLPDYSYTSHVANALLLLPYSSILKAGKNARANDARHQLMWTVLLTALRAELDDPQSVRAHIANFHDPLDGTPLELKDEPGEVRVAIKEGNGKPSQELRFSIQLQREAYWQLQPNR